MPRPQHAHSIDGEFVRVLAHELRNPLAIIMGSTDLLLDGEFGSLTAAQTQELQSIGRNAAEILELFNAALDLSRADAGHPTLEASEVNLTMLLHEIDLGTRHLQTRPNVDFVWRVAPDLPAIFTDSVRLKIVLKNLVANGLKFTEAGRVMLDARLIEDGIEFSVVDTGAGVPAEDLPFIFDAFRQAEQPKAQRYRGVGLGLYIARRFVEIMGGTIAVESELGRGSVFRVQLPLVPPRA